MNIVAFPGHEPEPEIDRPGIWTRLGWIILIGVILAGVLAEDVLRAVAWADGKPSLPHWDGAALFSLLVAKLTTTGVAFASIASARARAATHSANAGARHWRRAAYATALFAMLALLSPTVVALVETAHAAAGQRVFAVRIEASAVLAAAIAAALFVIARLSTSASEARRALAGFI